jgi:ABC-type transporter Mla MlaB component
MAEPPPRPLEFKVEGPITREDLPGLCERVCRLLGEHRPERAVCDCSSVPADAVTVEALSRLQLGARHYGCRVELANASPELVELVEFMGLSDVFALRPVSS